MEKAIIPPGTAPGPSLGPGPGPDPAMLRLDGLAAWRGDRLLFEGLDLALDAGGAAYVTGRNGAGKSTLLAIVAGLLRPLAGRRTVHGRIAFAAADASALDPRMTVAAALGYWARLDRPRMTVDAALDEIGLAHLVDVPVRYLSTGQRRRALLARILLSDAPVWLLDEPGNGLDDDGATRLAALVAAHRAGGGIVMIASHQPIALPDAVDIRIAS